MRGGGSEHCCLGHADTSASKVPPIDFDEAHAAFIAHANLSTHERFVELSKLKQTILVSRKMIIEHVMKEVGKCRTDALIAEMLGI